MTERKRKEAFCDDAQTTTNFRLFSRQIKKGQKIIVNLYLSKDIERTLIQILYLRSEV